MSGTLGKVSGTPGKVSGTLGKVFHNKTSWNITKYGILNLAMHGIIPLMDKRFTLSEDEEQEQDQDTLNKTISDLIQEKDVAKE